jgi:hypothetical protein
MNRIHLETSHNTENYTYITHEAPTPLIPTGTLEYSFGAPHHFAIHKKEDDRVLFNIDMQEGPIKERGVNGASNEDLLNIVLKRLACFQEKEYRCRENAIALTHLEEALLWLRHRTNKRVAAGTEGTSKK